MTSNGMKIGVTVAFIISSITMPIDVSKLFLASQIAIGVYLIWSFNRA